MSAVIIISIVACVLLILLVLLKPSVVIKGHNISIYWIAPFLGALSILCVGLISFREIFSAMTAASSVNPLKILILFLSITILSIFLDEAGFFAYLASVILKKAKTSQRKLFIFMYLIISLLTVFTSNDIIILTFTPFICYFSKNAKIHPIPFLIAEFIAANTWSLALIIGNPTNIYLASANGINFLQYASVMIVPTLFGGLTSFCLLLLLFWKKLSMPIEESSEIVVIKDKTQCIIGLAHLGACTVLLVISAYIGVEMWLITLCFAASLILCSLIYNLIKKRVPHELTASVKRTPWELIPFVLSMFVLVISLEKYYVTDKIAVFLGESFSVLKYGFTSFFSANIINNIPMSVLFTSIANGLSGKVLTRAVYASIVGSNIAAILTPLGALAGIMWTGILKKHEVKFSFLTFIKYGVYISIPTMFATLSGLMLMTM